MNLLKRASEESGMHEFDIVLDAVEVEVDKEAMPFVSPTHVMQYIRNTGDLPNFVKRHCITIITEKRQLQLI